ncbi:hypothetical protein PINS_up008264 [Pythium insidiosum]|nr:hypothetical protein PINS_up008264 [Pythium insidiosum]
MYVERQPEIIVLTDSSDESEDAAPSLLRPQLPPSRPKLKVKRRPSPSPSSSSASSVSTPSSVQRNALIAALEAATAIRRAPAPGKKLSTKAPTGGRRLPQRRRSVDDEEEEKIDTIGADGLLPEERFLLHGDGEDNEDDDDDDDDDEYRDGDASFGDGSRAFDRPRGATQSSRKRERSSAPPPSRRQRQSSSSLSEEEDEEDEIKRSK